MSIILSGDGSISGLSATGISAAQTVTSVPSSALPAGTVLQCLSTVKTDTFGSTSSTDAAITGLSVTITPKSATSKILVIATFNLDCNETYNARFNLYRNGSQLTAYRGDAAGSRAQATLIYRGLQGGQSQTNNWALGNMTYLDSPATTSATTYQVYCNTNGTIYINRSFDDYNNGDGARTASTITVMEIAA